MTLSIEGLSCGYRGVPVVRDAHLDVADGAALAVLGRNGAGKTTLLRTLMGVLPPVGGRILLDGQDVTRLRPADRARRGIAWVPEGRRLFGDLTVRENLEVALLDRSKRAALLDRVITLFPPVGTFLDRRGHALSGGQQQMVAVGRALMADPRIILFDEPSLGLAPIFVSAVLESVRGLREQGVTIVLVEQNVVAGLQVTDEAVVITNGHMGDRQTSAQLLEDGDVIERYLGGGETMTAIRSEA